MIGQWLQLKQLSESISFSSHRYIWKWQFRKNGNYSVKPCYDTLFINMHKSPIKYIWKIGAPAKIKILI